MDIRTIDETLSVAPQMLPEDVAALAAQGFTTVQTYELQNTEIANLRAAFDRNLLSVDVIGLPSITDAATARAATPGPQPISSTRRPGRSGSASTIAASRGESALMPSTPGPAPEWPRPPQWR